MSFNMIQKSFCSHVSSLIAMNYKILNLLGADPLMTPICACSNVFHIHHGVQSFVSQSDIE